MTITDTDIAEFKILYKEHFDIKLDDHEARHKLSLLVRQMEIVYRPVTKQQFVDLLEKDYGSKTHTSKLK